MVPCRVALFPLEEFFYVTLRFFLGTLSTQSIHRSAPTRLPPDLVLSSILPFRRAPSFLAAASLFPSFSFRALKKIHPPRQPPTSSVHRSRPTPFEARVVEPTDQTNHTQVSASASVSVRVSISLQRSPPARLVPVSPGLALSSPKSSGFSSSSLQSLAFPHDIDRLLSPTPPCVALARARPYHIDNISTSSTADCWTSMVVCIRQ